MGLSPGLSLAPESLRRFSGLVVRVSNLGFEISGSGFLVHGFGCRSEGLAIPSSALASFRVSGAAFRSELTVQGGSARRARWARLRGQASACPSQHSCEVRASEVLRETGGASFIFQRTVLGVGNSGALLPRVSSLIGVWGLGSEF